jgi:hypothetical protein
MRTLLSALLLSVALTAPVSAAAQAPTYDLGGGEQTQSLGAHVHGLAQLQIAQDGGTLTFVLDTPGYNLTGFERAPQTPQETAALDRARGLLNRPRLLAAVAGPAGCTASVPQVQADVFTATDPATAGPHQGHDHEHGHDNDHDHGHDDGHGHAQNVVASWTLSCATPASATRLSLGLFALFPRLEAVEVSFLGPAGAVGPTRLTPARPTLALAAR